MSDIPPHTDMTHPELKEETTAYNNAIPGVVDDLTAEGYHVIFSSAMLTSDEVGPDHIHPTDGGYDEIAAAFLSGATEAVSNEWWQEPDTNGALPVGCAGPDSEGGGPNADQDQRWEDHEVSFQEGLGKGNSYRWGDVNKDHYPELFVVKPDQSWTFYWNGGRAQTGWKPWVKGHSRPARAAGLVGNALRIAKLESNNEPDCVQIDVEGHLDVWVWDESKPAGEKICGKKLPQNVDVTGTGKIPPDTTISFADVDGDGRPDFLLTDRYGATRVWLWVKRKNKDGDYFAWSPFGQLVPKSSAEPRQWRWADLNGDGRADLILITEGGGAHAWLNEGFTDSPLAKLALHNIGEIAADKHVPPQDVQFVDLGGNGRADFVRIGWTGVMHIWLNRLTTADFTK